jgi:hypothetical protein
MKFCKAILPTLALALLSCGTLAADTSISLGEYRQQLKNMEERIHSLDDHPDQARNVIASIPDQVKVTTSSGAVTVNYHPLKNELTEFEKADRTSKPQRLEQIKNYILRLDTEATAYSQTSEDLASTREEHGRILSQSEFRKVHGPGVKETLLSKLYKWLDWLLSRLHVRGTSALGVLQFVVYLLIACALLLLLVWTINRLRRKEEEPPPREILPFAPSARSWRVWLAEARENAEKQDWRNAIHLAYWAGISFLESGGAWKPNRARTPREYLRLLSTRNPSYPPLSTLTRKFEVVWYGERPAAQQDFEESLGQLEKLGCQ